ncbi:MAG: DMT family transporter [Simkaniaceae bacterium]
MDYQNYNVKKGVFWIFIATISFAIMSALVKIIGDRVTIPTIIFFRFGLGFLLLLPWFLKDIKGILHSVCPWKLFFRSILALIAIFFTYMAIRRIPLVNAILLTNTASLFIPLVIRIALKRKTPVAVWWGVLIGFLGVVIVLNPGRDIFNLGSIYGLLSGLFAAVALVILRLMGIQTRPSQIFFYYFATSTLIGGIGAIFLREPLDLETMLLLLGIGIFGLIYQVGLTYGLKSAPVRLMSSLLFLSVVFGGFLDWLLFSHIPSLLTFLGMLLVVFGSLITIIWGRKRILPPKESE